MHFLTITTAKKQKCIVKLLTKSWKTRLTLSKNEQTYSHVDKYPGITEELDQVVHKEKTFFQAKKSCKHSNIKRVMNTWLLFGKLNQCFDFLLEKIKYILTVLTNPWLNVDFVYFLFLCTENSLTHQTVLFCEAPQV